MTWSTSVAEAGGNNNVTRAAVLEGGTEGITELRRRRHDRPERNVGRARPEPCYVLTQVKGGKFVRVFPKKAGTFECDPKSTYTIKLDLSSILDQTSASQLRRTRCTSTIGASRHVRASDG